MAGSLLLLCCCTQIFVRVATAQPSTYSNYQTFYETQWGGDHIQVANNGAQVDMRLDSSSGAGFQSIQSYTYGYFSMGMKLIPGNSAGTCTAFFVSSAGNSHDEIDFEFLGNATGQPYTLQTNMFAGGVGGREQQVRLWFDPTADYHTYAIIWNHVQIIWLVDDTPVRIFKNLQSMGQAYPSSQPTQGIASIFDGSSWVTEGGAIPIDYNYAPFISSYSQFEIDACVNDGVNVPDCATNYQNNWWEGSQYTSLSSSQITSLQNVIQNDTIYDYCKDRVRYPTTPFECSYNYNN